MVILFYARQTNTCLKPATKSLEIPEDTSNENLFKNTTTGCILQNNCSYLAKLIGKQLCKSLFFNKNARLRPATLLKRDSDKGVFLRILQNFKEHIFR